MEIRPVFFISDSTFSGFFAATWLAFPSTNIALYGAAGQANSQWPHPMQISSVTSGITRFSFIRNHMTCFCRTAFGACPAGCFFCLYYTVIFNKFCLPNLSKFFSLKVRGCKALVGQISSTFKLQL